MATHPSADHLEALDLVSPEHDRTTCSDDDSLGNEFPNEFGFARCVRCALIVALTHGCPPVYADLGWKLRVNGSAQWIGQPPAHYADDDRWPRD